MLHVAGIYSVGSSTRPDTRATFPNPLAASVAAVVPPAAAPAPAPAPTQTPRPLAFLDAGLDLRRAIYTSRWQLPAACGPHAVLSTSTYAHRQHRQLVVVEHSATGVASACSYAVQSCKGSASGVRAAAAAGQVGVTLYTVTAAEQSGNSSAPRIPPPVAAMASDAVPTTVTLLPAGWVRGGDAIKRSKRKHNVSSGLLLLLVVRTTLEPGVSSSSVAQLAATDLASFRAAGAAALAADHVAAWADVWGLAADSSGGGIEVAGNRSLAAQINSSM